MTQTSYFIVSSSVMLLSQTCILFLFIPYINGANTGNLAFQKSTNQSGVNNNYHISYFAVDGKYPNSKFANNTSDCAYTDSETPISWWYVDLGEDYLIGSIIMTQLHYGRMRNFSIDVTKTVPYNIAGFPENMSATRCFHSIGHMNLLKEVFQCTGPTVGRYVTLIVRNTRRLELCEFEVYRAQNAFFTRLDSGLCPDPRVTADVPHAVDSPTVCAIKCLAYDGLWTCVNFIFNGTTCRLMEVGNETCLDQGGWDAYVMKWAQ